MGLNNSKHLGLQVVELMGAEKEWGWWRRRKELRRATAYLRTFHSSPGGPAHMAPAKEASAPVGASTTKS